eukprot:g1751.t1
MLLALILTVSLISTHATTSNNRVVLGVDHFVNNKYKELNKSSRVGFIANPTSLLSGTLDHIIDVMHNDIVDKKLEIDELIVFGPEHGFRGAAEAGHGGKSKWLDPQTNLTVYNTYGLNLSALVQVIQETKIDTIIFDIQDIGARFYTFIWTMYDIMCAASSVVVLSSFSTTINFIVLDRPNPLGGKKIHGPMLETKYFSGVGKVNIPVQHGMTVGELALYFNSNAIQQCLPPSLLVSSSEPAIDNDDNDENVLNNIINVKVVKMTGWDSTKTFPIDIPFVLPSPNMPTLQTVFTYPGLCFLEGTTLSEGRGVSINCYISHRKYSF